MIRLKTFVFIILAVTTLKTVENVYPITEEIETIAPFFAIQQLIKKTEK